MDQADLEDLKEMMREQERVIEHQVHALEELDDKSEHMIRLAVAALAGAVALASLLLRGPDAIPGHSLLPLGVGAALNIAAMVLFVDAYVGFRRHSEAYVGPDPRWVAQRAVDPGWNLEKHLVALIEDQPAYFDHNREVIERSVERRKVGVFTLLASLVGYTGGYIYILWEVIMV